MGTVLLFTALAIVLINMALEVYYRNEIIYPR